MMMMKNVFFGASLVVQWMRICLPVQRTQVQSLVQENPTWAIRPKYCNYWSPSTWSLCSATRKATTVRSPHTAMKSNSHPLQQEEGTCSNKDPAQPKISQ